MLRFTLVRLVRGLVTLWLVVTAVFMALRLSGDPIVAMLGDEASVEAVARMRQRFGLDEPVPVQYARFLASLAHGDFGNSLREQRPAVEVVRERIPATVELATVSTAFAVLLGIPIGLIAAQRRNSLLDRGLMAAAFVGQSAPTFFVGILLILTFSLWLHLLPSSGRGGVAHLIMPAFTLGAHSLTTLARLTRSAVLEVLGQDFVRTARSKGLRRQPLVVHHVLRNAALPIVTVVGLHVGVAIAGAVVTETVFAWPGVGRLAATAVFNRDYPVIQVVVLVVACAVVTVNFATDLLYGWLDPRVRGQAA